MDGNHKLKQKLRVANLILTWQDLVFKLILLKENI